MKHVIIGTAGHVDHGKTTLIQALTGTNPDRLKEEQERGMTIDIGFASLRLPDGTIAGIVDVPGHERFLKNMLAGASGVDVVLLVIAADEGVMPQTVEHIDVLRLLDVKNGVVALTKMDAADKEWTEVVEEDVRQHLKDTFLANAPIIRVSSTTGKGIEALKKALMAAVSRAEARNASLPFRLPIDRVFTRPGFGTVVTGTLASGTIRTGDAVEIVPQKVSARVRGLQVHNQKVSEAEAGSRVAINLAGIDAIELERGAQVAPPGSITPTTSFDAVLRLLPNADRLLEDRARVRVHLGTLEVLGRIQILENKSELGPGERSYVQFRGEAEFAALRGDRFVVRMYSPMTVIGGGIVLDTQPGRHRKDEAVTLSGLEAKERGTPEDLAETLLLRSPAGALRAEIAPAIGITPAEANSAIETLLSGQNIVLLPHERIIHSLVLQGLTQRTKEAVERFHEQFPLRPGLPREELRATLGKNMDTKAFGSLLSHWHKEQRFTSEGAFVRRANFQVQLNSKQQQLLAQIEEIYKRYDIAVPTLEEVAKELRTPVDAITSLLKVGQERNSFVKVEDGVYYHADTITRLQNVLREYLQIHDSISVGAFRDLTQSNRRFSMLALEYLDTIKFTRRVGDERTLY